MLNNRVSNAYLYLILAIALLFSAPSSAQSPATFLVATASLLADTPATPETASTFQRIDFDRAFASGTTPNVFVMTPEFSTDPCLIRINNIDNTGFDAACIEPINEDNAVPAVSFDYIAIIDGTLNVPIAGSMDTVRFESQCAPVDTQEFGPNCANCLLGGKVKGYTPQSFLTAFENPPALLTQISSTINTYVGATGIPAGEPEFLEAAVETNSLTAADFDWTLDRMEAGNGTISSAETLCYLAVERDGCQDLDFSTLDGPASVTFAAVHGGNVDGRNNGATSGEGATFPAACFSSVPVTIGSSRSRRGNNGGFLRHVSQTTAEVIYTYDEDRISDNERNHIDEQVSAIAFSSVFTTPVTLSKAQVSQRGRKTSFEWETASETFHLGFHLWGETPTGWEQLNRRLILGAGIDTATTQRYKRRVTLDRRQQNEMSRFGISTVDNTGFEEFYGPFELGAEYGEEANNEAVNWSKARTEYEQNMLTRGFVKKNGRWKKVSQKAKRRLARKQLGVDSSVLNLEFETSGIHAVSAQRILQELPIWAGVPLDEIAITLNGDAVFRDIVSEDDYFDNADQIVMNVIKPNGADAIYLKNYVYQIRLDASRARGVSHFETKNLGSAGTHIGSTQNSGMVSITATSDKLYSAGIDADKPWYDHRLLSRGSPSSAVYTIDFRNPIDTSRKTMIDFTLFGGLDLPGDVNDHHVAIPVNGTTIEDISFDGLTRYTQRVELPAGLVTQFDNRVAVTVIGDTGLIADLVLVGEVTLSAPEFLTNELSSDFFVSQGLARYQVSVNNPAKTLVYAYTKNGLITRVKPTRKGQHLLFETLPGADTLRSDLKFSVKEVLNLPQPQNIELAEIEHQHTDIGELLIVAHPNFIGEELASYAQFKRDNGYTVTIVDWLKLVATYGYGNNSPQALNNFLALALPAEARRDENINNVLIVGGHSYDYLNILDDNIVNFIPTHYRKVSLFNFTPSDNAFADLNHDQLPDIAIGRWPVRTQADLELIIKKSLDWQANRDASPYQHALLISQANDSSNLNFTKQLDQHIGIPLSRLNKIESVSKISMQALSDSGADNPIQAARDIIQRQIDGGLELLSFAGHGSYGSWGFQGVVNTDFVKNLSNQGKPTLVMPLACYTTNYEHPSVNTLAHQWLFAGDKGAVAIHGASVLGEYRNNAVFSERYINQMPSSKTVGEAIFKAKNEMANSNQLLHNWAYLGDPTLPLH
jgi:hypothetical protein